MRRHVPIVLAVGALLLGSAAPGGAASRSALSAFHTPDWRVQCTVVGEEIPPRLSCTTRDGLIVSMGARTRVKLIRTKAAYRHDVFAARRLVNAGGSWAFGSRFGCAYQSARLHCWNRVSHGWWLGPAERYRLE
jgi:hypothetical protein